MDNTIDIGNEKIILSLINQLILRTCMSTKKLSDNNCINLSNYLKILIFFPNFELY